MEMYGVRVARESAGHPHTWIDIGEYKSPCQRTEGFFFFFLVLEDIYVYGIFGHYQTLSGAVHRAMR